MNRMAVLATAIALAAPTAAAVAQTPAATAAGVAQMPTPDPTRLALAHKLIEPRQCPAQQRRKPRQQLARGFA